MKIKYILPWLWLCVLISCDSEVDIFKQDNQPISWEFRTPEGAYNLSVGVFFDSVKIAQPRSFSITLNDDMASLQARLAFDKGENMVNIVMNQDTIRPSQSYIIKTGQATPMTVIGRSQGQVAALLTLIDAYGQEASIPISLLVFRNLYPVCKAEVKAVQELSSYEYLIDLSQSYDLDARFGGTIVGYEYKIGNYYQLTTNKDRIYHIFPTVGTYDVKCRVKDNDGAWSDVIPITATVD